MAKQHSRLICLMLTAFLLLSAIAVAVPARADEGEPAASQTRDFNATYDRMLDAVAGSTTAQQAYRASAWEAGKCDDIEDPIFKIASPRIAAGFDQLLLEVRSPDESVKLADLTLGIRISDAVPVQPYALNSADITGGITLSEGEDIGSAWTTISIDFAQTEVGIETGNPDAMVGFHLYANGGAGRLDIRRVAVAKGGNETEIRKYDDADYGFWWEGGESGTNQVIPAAYAVNGTLQIASEVETSNNTDGKYSAIALGIFGSGSVTVAPVLADGSVGAAKAWSELKDLEGNALSAIAGAPRNTVIALDSLGAKEIRGVELACADGTAYVSCAFFTNLETVVPSIHFPVLDMESADYMTKFDYEYANAGADYDAAVSDCAEFGMTYILSYSAKNNVITDGHLVLDAKGEAYTGIKLRSTVASAGRRYLVIKYMLKNRTELGDFRFDVLTTDTDSGVAVKYPHEWYVDTGLLSTSSLNPYAGGKYSYLVIDVAKTWGVGDISGVDMYISGEGQILIDEIFYADAVRPGLEYTDEVLADDFAGKELTAAGAGYAYVGWVNGSLGRGCRYMQMTVEGDISKLRIGMGGGTFWVTENAEGTLKDVYGNNIAQTTGTQTLMIDLLATGVDIDALSDIHIHNDFAAEGDVLKITSVKFARELAPKLDWSDEVLADDFAGKELTAGGEGYAYVGWANGSLGRGSRYMQLEVEGDISQLRMEMGGGVYWATENAEGTLLDHNGRKLGTVTGKQTLVIDLVASGVNVNALSDIHIHNTFAAEGDVLKITSLKFANEPAPEITWGDEALADDFAGKEVTAEGEGYTYMGMVKAGENVGSRYMMVAVDGDISQLRIEMGGGVYWVSENPEGTLKTVYGRNIANLNGQQVLVIDLVASGVKVDALNEIHFHNTFAAAGDVLKITSVKFGNQQIDLTSNDDSKPVISWTLGENIKAGDVVTLKATASDNCSAPENIRITFEVTLGGKSVEVKDGKFTAEAGTYTIKVTATDEAGNKAEETKTVTVAPADKAPNDAKGGANVVLIIVIVVVVVAAAVVAIVLLRKKKN